MHRLIRRLRASAEPGRGQTMVDFALMTPLIVLMMMGVMDFGVAVSTATQITSAVQAGVSYARSSPNDTAGIRLRVKNESTNLIIADSDITVTCYSGLTTTTKTCSTATFGDSVKVQATFNYQPVTGRLASITGAPIAIIQSATSEIY